MAIISNVNLVGAVLTFSTLVMLSSGSAIPMWEFLSRGEKMSHLYSMFAKQVSAHCKSTSTDVPVAVCKRDLLVYGIGRLEKMSDIYLDSMDPYQRGVNDLIWDSMVEGHSSMPAKRHQRPTQAPIRRPIGPYQHNPLFDDRSDSPASDSLNEATSSSSASSLAYAMDMDNSYSSYPSAVENQYISSEPSHNQLSPEASSVQLNYDNQNHNNYLTGPMVVRVRPDGTPVDEGQRVVLPRDDDREAMSIGKQRLPTIAQITNEYRTSSSSAAESAPAMRRSLFFYPANYRVARRHY